MDKNHQRGSNYCAFAPPRVITQMLILLALNLCTGCCARQPVARNKNESGREREKESTYNKEEFLVSRTVRASRQDHHAGTQWLNRNNKNSARWLSQQSVARYIFIYLLCDILFNRTKGCLSPASQPSCQPHSDEMREGGKGSLPLGAASRKRKGYPRVVPLDETHSSCSKLNRCVETAGKMKLPKC